MRKKCGTNFFFSHISRRKKKKSPTLQNFFYKTLTFTNELFSKIDINDIKGTGPSVFYFLVQKDWKKSWVIFWCKKIEKKVGSLFSAKRLKKKLGNFLVQKD